MTTEGTTAPVSSAPADKQRVEVVLKHEVPTQAPSPAPVARLEETSGKKGKKDKDAVRVGDSDDYRHMSTDQFTARLQEESYRGAQRVLKQMGVPKEQREQILSTIDESKGAYKVLKAEEIDSFNKVKEEFESAKPKVGKIDGYEKRLAALAEKEFNSLPEAARKQIEKRLPKDADALARLDAIEEAREYMAALAPKEPTAEEKAAVEAAKVAAAQAAPPNPSNTGAAPGPNQTKAPNTLTEYEQWQDMKKRAPFAAAGFFQKHATKIAQQMKALSK